MKERLFLALPVYEVFQKEIDAFLAKYYAAGSGYRWSPVKSLHVTLHFFGDTESEEKEKILKLIPELLKETVLIEAALTGIHAFPHAGKPRIIFAGVHAASYETLMPLQAGIVSALGHAGFAAESRKYHPHVTLCRIKEAHETAWKKEAWSFPETRFKKLTQVILYRSLLTPAGAEHHAEAIWHLGVKP